jgi:glycosyltransferase involved in cell wall biosynthesis
MPELTAPKFSCSDNRLISEQVGLSGIDSEPGILHGRDILCFSHDWTGDPLSKTHLMRLLARENRVLWVNSIGYRRPSATARDFRRAFSKVVAATRPLYEAEPNIFVVSPLVVPAYGNPIIRAFNRRFLRFQVKRAMSRLRFQKSLNWVFNPAAAPIAGTLGEDRVIYYCVDEYSAFAGVSSESMVDMERQLIRKADLVVLSADRLYQAKGSQNPHTILVRHGVDYEHFRKALDPGTQVPDEIMRLQRPVIGYFGLIASDWVDIALVARVAESFPTASIVMLGKVTMDVSVLKRYPNVHLLGRKPYDSLPAYCKGFDVALIPFPINEATLHSNPLKAREYLAAGLPVISTAIPEVEVLGQCRIGEDAEAFVQHVREALKNPGPCAHRSRSMQAEGWQSRLREVCRHLPPESTGFDAR